MAVRLRLKRLGRRHRSFYRLCAMDSHTPRDGRVIEELGWYDPQAKESDKQLSLNRERIEYWLGVGAQPTETVSQLLKRRGVAKSEHAAAEPAQIPEPPPPGEAPPPDTPQPPPSVEDQGAAAEAQ